MTSEELYRRFVVDVQAGRLWWKIPPARHPFLAGKEAGGLGSPNTSGKVYWIVNIGGKAYRRGRLIFLAHHGRFPVPSVDHENRISLDDRIENLREATVLQNSRNRSDQKRYTTNLPPGVSTNKNKHRNKYKARIHHMGRRISLGNYSTPEEANAAYTAKRRELYGEFAPY